MKSYARFLQGLYGSLLSTVSEYIPSLRRDCERDMSRLLSLVDSRGLSFLMIDLPEAGKHFDKSLAAGRLIRSGIPGQTGFRRGEPIPRLFKGMVLRVFDEGGLLRVNPDIDCIRYLRQLYLAGKKVRVQCDASRTWKQVHEFFEVDQGVRLPSLNWDEDELRIDGLRDLHFGDPCDLNPIPLLDHFGVECEEPFATLDPEIADVVQRTADAVSAIIGGFNPLEWRTKHGPGAVTDQRHTQFKYDFPNWPAKLENVFPVADFGFANYAAWSAFLGSQESHELFRANEPPSKLIAVPKTLKGPRLIAAEPVAHQWCQQAILDFLTTRLASSPIGSSVRFRDQTPNQSLARRASHTQSHMTIDLSSASDRVSCWVVERLFRRIPSLVQALHASRTRWVANTIDAKSPNFHKLRKFACMGSACTFPVQSALFAVITIASLLIARKQNVTIANVRKAALEVQVFGDDIVAPMDCGEVLLGLLEDLGLKINQNKTFGTGKFRESCGVDAFDGHDVTPTYTTSYPDVSRPESIMSSVDTHNNFVNRGYYRTADYIKTTVHALRRFSFQHVPMGSGAFGWYDPFCAGNPSLRKRWNPTLQRVEVLCDVISTKSKRTPVERDSVVLQYFTEARSTAPFIQRGDRLGLPQRSTQNLRRRWEPLVAL